MIKKHDDDDDDDDDEENSYCIGGFSLGAKPRKRGYSA